MHETLYPQKWNGQIKFAAITWVTSCFFIQLIQTTIQNHYWIVSFVDQNGRHDVVPITEVSCFIQICMFVVQKIPPSLSTPWLNLVKIIVRMYNIIRALPKTLCTQVSKNWTAVSKFSERKKKPWKKLGAKNKMTIWQKEVSLKKALPY